MSVIVIAVKARDAVHFIESCHPSMLIKFAPISNNVARIRPPPLPNLEEANTQNAQG